MKKLITVLALALVAIGIVGCVTSKHQVVTTDPVTGVSITNLITVVDTNKLDLECAGFEVAATAIGVYALQQHPQDRQIVEDIATALTGALDGPNQDVVTKIRELIKADPSFEKQITPLVNSISAMQKIWLSKHDGKAGVIITKRILRAALNAANATLATVPAQES